MNPSATRTSNEATHMQLDQYFVRLTSLALFNKVENLVRQSLRGDWIVRIQYGEQLSADDYRWQQWKSPFFALQDANELNEAILACRMNFPHHPIRLYAEKTRPESRFIYTLYTPSEHSVLKQRTEQEPLRHAELDGYAPLPAAQGN
jgi:ribulose bisphosphate carboxylase small subunit